MSERETCGAQTAKGEPCSHPATSGEFCWQHDDDEATSPGRPDKFSESRAEQACDMARVGASIEGCARAAGVSGDTLRRWLDKYPQFRAIFRQARAKGERRRLKGDSQQDRFILSRSFGYEEQKRLDQTTDGEPIDQRSAEPDNGAVLKALEMLARDDE